MPDPMQPEFTAQNPIVAAAQRIRSQRAVEAALDAGTASSAPRKPEDAEAALRLFCELLAGGCKRLNAILGERGGVKLVRYERPLRARVLFREDRIALDLDDVHQLVRVSGCGLDGEYQFDPAAQTPALINLSKLSTEAEYGERLTPASLLKRLASSAELPPPASLTGLGPLSFSP
jgi:hypothetical protein